MSTFPLTRIERDTLAVSSALGAVVDPRRAGTFLQASLSYTISDTQLIDLVAALGEVTAGPFIQTASRIMFIREVASIEDEPVVDLGDEEIFSSDLGVFSRSSA